MRRRRRGAEAGFTLIELLVVMAILGGVMALAVAARPGAASLRLDATARAMAAGLRAARMAAMLRGSETAFAIDAGARSYGMPGAWQPLPPDMTATVDVAASERGRAGGAIRFFPDGRSSGGSVTLGLEGRSVLVAVDWLTGEPWVR